MNGQNRRGWSRRRGNTLLELVGATTVIAVALVPALRLMRDSLRVSRETETANLLATLSAGLLEEHLLRTAANWAPATFAGTFADQGYPRLRFEVVRSDAAADGGLAGSLMSITATAWEDRDDDGRWDAGEPRSRFASKLARNVAYQREANGT